MGNLNKVLLIGRLGRDPEVRFTQSGQAVCTFSMATTERYKSGDDWQERTEWHNIVVWGRRGETVGQYLKKGSQAFIEGRLQTRKWQGKDGNDRYTTEVVANKVEFLDSRQSQGGSWSDDQPPAPDDGDMNQGMNEDDDIPF